MSSIIIRFALQCTVHTLCSNIFSICFTFTFFIQTLEHYRLNIDVHAAFLFLSFIFHILFLYSPHMRYKMLCVCSYYGRVNCNLLNLEEFTFHSLQFIDSLMLWWWIWCIYNCVRVHIHLSSYGWYMQKRIIIIQMRHSRSRALKLFGSSILKFSEYNNNKNLYRSPLNPQSATDMHISYTTTLCAMFSFSYSFIL